VITRLLAVSLLLFSMSCRSPSSSDYRLYSLVLSHNIPTAPSEHLDKVVIADQSIGIGEANPSVLPKGSDILASITSEFEGIDPQTAADYVAKNKQPISLSSSFQLPLKCVLIDHREAARYYDGRYWPEFESMFPKACSLFRVSRIGYNKSRTEALFYVEGRRGEHSGAGSLVLLRKDGNGWQVIHAGFHWVS
jgi:hypothetical protein